MGFAALYPSYEVPAMRRRDLLRGLAATFALPQLGIPIAMAAPAMLTRPIPSSGEAMPVVGLGTSHVFDVGADSGARPPLRAVLQAFVEAGGNIIDTPPMYCGAG